MTISKDIIEAVQNAILEGKKETSVMLGEVLFSCAMDYEIEDHPNGETDPTAYRGYYKCVVHSVVVTVSGVELGRFDSERFVLQSNLSGEY